MSTARIGSTMYAVAIAGVVGLLAWLFYEQLEQRRNPNRDIATRAAPDGAASVTLQRNRYGHYVVDGTINATPAEFMLDTGASEVAVSAGLAERAGLEPGRAVTVTTANGRTTAYTTLIDSIALGGIVEHGVRATIVPNLGDIEVLLGMSFLERLDFAQRGNTLVIKSRRAATGGAP